MANTYTLLNSSTVGAGGASSITFSAIPSTYTDLLVKASIRMSDAAYGYDNVKISINGTPSGTAYSGKLVADYVGGALSQSSSSAASFDYFYSNGNIGTASIFSNGEFYIPNAFGSNYKSISADSVTEDNTGASYYTTRGFGAGLWSSTSAITSIVLTPPNGTFVQYSSFYLYGIKNS